MPTDPLSFLAEELDDLKKKNLFRKLKVLETEQKATSTIDGRQVVNLSSNNYLGLTTHPRLREAAIEATRKYGVGSAAVRTIIGTMSIHEELETKLARFKGTEAALVFQSGFTTNVAVCQSLMSAEQDLLVSDELNHASIIDGARLAKSPRKIYPHKDMAALKRILEEGKGARRTLIVTDGVFSMDGDIAPLPDIVDLAEKFGAIVMVDDAHASGVLGENGRGSVSHWKLEGRVPIQIGTLSKAIASIGGYVAGTRLLREYLVHKARPFLFSSSHPPSVSATCIAAIDVLLTEPELLRRMWDNARYFKEGLARLGFNTGASETPITPVIAGETSKAMRLSDRLFEEGVFAQGIGFPTVAEGRARVRTIVTAAHTRAELDFALDKFAKVGRELELLR
ncbi:MAG: glycine C-acetyltransferase [Planctomycetes bacterium]|nr:glycine C-acetyltransferase [Planctomycetota bacterium]